MAGTQIHRVVKTIGLLVVLLICKNELLAIVQDTLILDGQLIYLDQDTLNPNEGEIFDYTRDYRKIRKKGIWGLEANVGGVSLAHQFVQQPPGYSPLYNMSPDFKSRFWGMGIGLTAYYHFQNHFAIRTGIERNSISWKSSWIDNTEGWNKLDIFELSFNTTGLQAFHKVLVDTASALYELDTLTLNPKENIHQIQLVSVPVMAAFHLNGFGKPRSNMILLEMGAVFHSYHVQSPMFTVLSEDHRLVNVASVNKDWSSWDMRTAFTWKRLLYKQGRNAWFLISRFQLDWPPHAFKQYDWSWKMPSSYLTFGILWERGKSLHSLNI